MEELELQEQSDAIQRLLSEAGEQGYLTLDRLLEAFPKAEDHLEQLDDLYRFCLPRVLCCRMKPFWRC